jgi:hypothetical protein
MAVPPASGTLQSSLDEAHAATAAPSSSKGSTDVIRVMLREQKRECATLHANPLFKEFRDRQKRSSRTGHGHDAQAPPVIEDLEAGERLTDSVQHSSASYGLRCPTTSRALQNEPAHWHDCNLQQQITVASGCPTPQPGCLAGKHDVEAAAHAWCALLPQSWSSAFVCAEGQARLIDFIKSAAAEREAAPAGVWANFGKPYACLGELQQVCAHRMCLIAPFQSNTWTGCL